MTALNMTELQSQARIQLSEPDRVLGKLCRHMAEHDVLYEEGAGSRTLRFTNSTARFTHDGDETVIDIRSTDLEGIYFARMAVASHIKEFAIGPAPAIEWQGDGGNLVRPPNFQILEVRNIRDITPHMRRLTLHGEDIARFAPLDALHLNILVQKPGSSEPQWPTVGADGTIRWADPELRPDFRKYTVRSVDIEARTLEIDFVLHADAGPGSRLAETAKVGERIGVSGPGGGGLIEAEWYLFAGDETALPAIARMIEALPDTATGKVLIEVADKHEVQQLRHPAGIELNWLLREDFQDKAASPLLDAIRQTEIPRGDGRVYVWSGCEFETFRSIRNHLRTEIRLEKNEHLVVSYWRRGVAES